VTFPRPDVNFPSAIAGGGDAGEAVPPAISLGVCGTVGKAAPGPAVPGWKVTTVMWLNGILLTQMQVGDLVFAPERSGAV
jgi:hypothetical protein